MPSDDEHPPMPAFSRGPLSGGLKVRGNAGLVERLRSLRKRDLAFIAAGLSVLCMAPVAEHFLLGSGEPSEALQSGFDRRGSLLPDGAALYENGAGGLSPGGLIGEGGNDVVTPLNVRDPSALIMGPATAQKLAATGQPAAAAVPQGGPAGTDWKNAITQAASRGAQAAVKKAQLPTPGRKMSGALRGLAALSSSGGGPALRLDPLSAASVPNRAKEVHSLAGVQPAPGFRGAARLSPMSGGSESLKSAGNRQADIMNKGAAPASLEAAARATPPSGGGAAISSGGPGEGGETKAAGGSTAKDHRGITMGENLDLLRAKLNIEKSIDLKWKKRSWREFERQKLIEELLIKSAIEGIVGKGLFDPIGKAIADAFGSLAGGPKGMSCIVNGSIVSYTMDEWSKYGRQAAQNGGYIGTCRPWPGSGGDGAQAGASSGDQPSSAAAPPGASPAPEASAQESGSVPAASSSRESLRGLDSRLAGLQGASRAAGQEAGLVDVRSWTSKPEWEALASKIKDGEDALAKAREELGNAQSGMEAANAGVESLVAADERALEAISAMTAGAQGTLERLSEGLKRNPVRHGLDERGFQEALASKAAAVDGPGSQSLQSAAQSLGEAREAAGDAKKALARAGDLLARASRALADSRAEYARLSQRSAPEAEKAIGSVNDAMGALNGAVAAAGVARDQVAGAVRLGEESVRNAEAAQRAAERAAAEAGTGGAVYGALKLAWEGAPPARGARELEGRRVVQTVSDPASEASRTEVQAALDSLSRAGQRLGRGEGTLIRLGQEAAQRLEQARRALSGSRGPNAPPRG